MVLEEDTKQIPHLPLVPIRTMVHRHSTRDRIHLARTRLHPDPPTELHAQQMVHDLEPFLALGVVYAADIHEGFELALAVVPEEREDGHDRGRGDVEGQLVLEDGELLDEFGQALREVRPVVVQLLRRFRVLGQSGVGRSRFGEWRG